jgi:hypothetical protein
MTPPIEAKSLIVLGSPRSRGSPAEEIILKVPPYCGWDEDGEVDELGGALVTGVVDAGVVTVGLVAAGPVGGGEVVVDVVGLLQAASIKPTVNRITTNR